MCNNRNLRRLDLENMHQLKMNEAWAEALVIIDKAFKVGSFTIDELMDTIDLIEECLDEIMAMKIKVNPKICMRLVMLREMLEFKLQHNNLAVDKD